MPFAMTSEPIEPRFTSSWDRISQSVRAEARRLSPRVSIVIAALIAAALAYYHGRYEGERETLVFASAITTALVAMLTFATRRLLLSIAVVGAALTLVVAASDVKRHYVDMVLHAYDVVFYLTSPATLKFLWVDHKGPLIGLFACFVLIALGSAWLYSADGSRIARTTSGGVAIACIAIATWASYAKGERRNTLFYWDTLYISSFYASWAETLETLWRGQLLEAADAASGPPFALPESCTPAERPPHIFLIHQESVVPPSFFPSLAYDQSLDPFFKSFDNKLHRLRVETYGGASWLTEFSVIAGVSTYSFGGMRTFVQSLMQGKVHDTLPQSLTRCGYRNSVFYPVPKDFVSNGRFYAAAGMPEIFDFKAQGAKRYNERDRFYYGNALSHLERHIASSDKPLFSYIITSATHLPYNKPYEPEVNVPGGGVGTPAEMSEFLRRLAMAKMDYGEFRAELQRRFPNEKFLIMQYGDHQPVATRTLLGYDSKLTAEDVKLNSDSPGLLTYYSIEGLNYEPPKMPEVDVLDVPYLGVVLLNAARLPLSDANVERLSLLSACDGRYYTCADRDKILRFHRRLLDSGLVEAR